VAHLNGGVLEHVRGLRIAHLIESDGPGGAERMLANIATQLQAAGAQNLAILPADGEGWLARELAGTGVAIEYFRLDRPVSGKLARWLVATLRCYEINVAHSHEFTMAVYGSWAARRAGICHVITMHGSRYYAQRLRRRLALRLAVASSACLVAVSQTLASHLSRDLWIRRSRVRTIPNGVALAPVERSSLRDELRLRPGDLLMLAVGNLYPVKGHGYLLDALGTLADRFPQLHVAIAGRGELVSTLRARAEELGVGHRFHLLGLRSDIANILAGADLFVLPSVSEGLPLALLEAMMARRPIIASAVGEIPVALAGGAAGVLVKPADPPALAAAVARLLTDRHEAERLAAAAEQRAADEYSLSRMVERYSALYARD
jgi:glycosyltransferase involved in cell wall biosynthesis